MFARNSAPRTRNLGNELIDSCMTTKQTHLASFLARPTWCCARWLPPLIRRAVRQWFRSFARSSRGLSCSAIVSLATTSTSVHASTTCKQRPVSACIQRTRFLCFGTRGLGSASRSTACVGRGIDRGAPPLSPQKTTKNSEEKGKKKEASRRQEPQTARRQEREQLGNTTQASPRHMKAAMDLPLPPFLLLLLLTSECLPLRNEQRARFSLAAHQTHGDAGTPSTLSAATPSSSSSSSCPAAPCWSLAVSASS